MDGNGIAPCHYSQHGPASVQHRSSIVVQHARVTPAAQQQQEQRRHSSSSSSRSSNAAATQRQQQQLRPAPAPSNRHASLPAVRYRTSTRPRPLPRPRPQQLSTGRGQSASDVAQQPISAANTITLRGRRLCVDSRGGGVGASRPLACETSHGPPHVSWAQCLSRGPCL